MPISMMKPPATNFRTWEQSWLDAESLWAGSGGNPANFHQGLLGWLDGGSFLPPRDLLSQIETALPRLFREPEPRLALADIFLDIWNGLHPFAPISRVHCRATDGCIDLWLKVGIPDEESTLDMAWLLMPLIRAFPRAFSLPEYEVLQPIADPRQAADILAGDADPGGEGSDAPLGESVNFLSHLHLRGLPVPEGWENGGMATLVRTDCICPRRRRAVLRSGCVYGSPGFLLRVGFRSLRPQGWNPLSLIIRAVAGTGGDVRNGKILFPQEPKPSLEREPDPPHAHGATHRFVYHRADDSISCDGRHLTKRVPARILRRMVMDFVNSGRREFEFRSFKRDADIVTNRKRPNFEVRLRRVLEVVRGSSCGLTLHRRRPGLLELEASGAIEYAEE